MIVFCGKAFHQFREILFITFILLLLPSKVEGQLCDTLYSHENYVERTVRVNYRPCNSVYADTNYRIVQWMNIDSNYQRAFFSENICQYLFHSKTGNLIHERWSQGDTNHFKSYYPSGKIKSHTTSYYTREPYYFHDSRKEYYENGNIKYEGEYKSSSFSFHTSYYLSGALETKARRFSYNPSPFGDYIEYFPNGQISSIRTYSEPDTTTNLYQTARLLSAKFYDESGQTVEQDLNMYDNQTIWLYPPKEIESAFSNSEFYPASDFEMQEAYSKDMSLFKERLINALENSLSLSCRKAVVKLEFTINTKGKIENTDVSSQNESLDKEIKNAIKKIGKWPVAIKDGSKVDVYISTYFILDL